MNTKNERSGRANSFVPLLSSKAFLIQTRVAYLVPKIPKARDSFLLGAHRCRNRAAGLGSPHPGPPPRPPFGPQRFQGQYARPGHGRARTPQFLLSRQRIRCCQCCRLRLAQRRLKSLCVFCIMLLLNSPLGGGAKNPAEDFCSEDLNVRL